MANYVHIVTTVLVTFVSVVAAGHALVNKRDPRAAFGWIAVSLLFPIAGPLLYVLFGVNRVNTRAREMDHRWTSPRFTAGEYAVDVAHVPTDCIELARISDAVTKRPLVRGNRVEPLRDGEEAYPPMLEAIRNAERSIVLLTYIFETNPVGREFIEALIAARERGVDVRVLIDGLGEWYAWPRASRLLRRGGVRVARFLPPRLIPPTFRVNLRNHRKILVVDGDVAFTGGMNIGSRHMARDPANTHPTSDLHFRVLGPIVRQIEEVFHEDWTFVTGEPAPEPAPPPEPRGESICRTILDGPNDDIDKLTSILVAAISAARQRIDIMTPYFLPPREMTSALQSAALRGVDVHIVLPSNNNLPFVHWATRNMLWEVLKYGAKVYYQPPPFNHAKLFAVDGHYAQFGSANLDTRSLRLNFELTVEVYDRGLGERALAWFDDIRVHSEPVTLDILDRRSLPVRARDALCWLFTPYL